MYLLFSLPVCSHIPTGDDYLGISRSLTFTSLLETITIGVRILDDVGPENRESFLLQLINGESSVVDIAPGLMNISILDDDSM